MVHLDFLSLGVVLLGRSGASGAAQLVQLQHIPAQGVDCQHAAHHGGGGNKEGVETDGAQGGHDLIVGSQLRPQSEDEQEQGGGLKPAQPGQRPGAEGGTGAQKEADGYQSQVGGQADQGAGDLLHEEKPPWVRKGRRAGTVLRPEETELS